MTPAQRFARQLEIKLVEQGESQARLADRIGMSERTFTRRKRDGLWTLPQVRSIFKILRYTEEEQLKSIKGER